MDAQSSGSSGPGLMPPPGFIEPREPKIPARVNFALDIVHWANEIEKGNQQRSYDGGPSSQEGGRSLREDEKSVYGAALEVMRLYLTGEMSFEGEAEEGYEEDGEVDSKPCFFCSKKSEEPS